MSFITFFALNLLVPCFLFGHSSQNEAVFTNIYTSKTWGTNEQGEGSSGHGSRMDQTVEYREFLQNFLKEHNIRSVVDIGCGDWSFSHAIDWSNIDYLGFDVVEKVIEKNISTYEAENIHFAVLDASESELPPADLLVCKDVLQHLPNEDVAKFLEKISCYKYCLITNDVDPATKTAQNSNINPGSYRHLDLTKAPFAIKAEPVLAYQSAGTLKQVVLITASELLSEHFEQD